MDIIIIVLAILGFSSVIIAAYVISAATRKSNTTQTVEVPSIDPIPLDRRRGRERRRAEPAQFPLKINGTVITEDRRRLPERRVRPAA